MSPEPQITQSLTAQLLDYARGHRKAILALLSLLLLQFVDSDTADWIVLAVGTLLVGGVPNDQVALARNKIRRERAANRRAGERGSIDVGLLLVLLGLVIGVLLNYFIGIVIVLVGLVLILAPHLNSRR